MEDLYSVEIIYRSGKIKLYKTPKNIPTILNKLTFELRKEDIEKILIRKYIRDTIYQIDYL